MNYMGNQRFQMVDQQETQLKRTRTTAVILAVLLAVSFAAIFWLACKLDQTNQALSDLLTDAQQLLQRTTSAEEELTRVKQELEDTESEFKESFNLLYPAYVAVENVRYIGMGSQTYHYFNCSLFSEVDTYTAHNREYCDTLGYTPCPVCCSE